MMGRTQDWDRFTRTVPSWEKYATARQRWMDTGSSIYLDQMIEAMPPEGDVPDIVEKPRQTWLTMQGPPEPALLPENKEREIRELCHQELGWWKWWLLRHHQVSSAPLSSLTKFWKVRPERQKAEQRKGGA